MVGVIPGVPREGANRSEKQIFMALESLMDSRDWTVIHSMQLAQNLGIDWDDVLYVGMTRGRYRCVMLEGETNG